MRTNSNKASLLSLSATLVISILSGCVTEPADAQEEDLDGLDETSQEALSSSTSSVTALPSFSGTPNIKQLVSTLPNPTAMAVVRTSNGFQIYRCEQGATAPEWKLRTPVAVLEPSPDVQRVSLNKSRLSSLAASYHYRSDFGGFLLPAQLDMLGLTNPPVNAPIWDFTFQANGQLRREAYAGRVLATDVTSTANVPMLLLEVRGRAVDPGTPRVLASATHVLRWNTRGGLAPAASTCNASSLGREFQSPYSADYYFITAR